MNYQHCQGGKHDLSVITKRYDGAPGIERVVRWCRNCGAVVIDIDLDGRTHQPGGGMPMIFPRIASAGMEGKANGN